MAVLTNKASKVSAARISVRPATRGRRARGTGGKALLARSATGTAANDSDIDEDSDDAGVNAASLDGSADDETDEALDAAGHAVSDDQTIDEADEADDADERDGDEQPAAVNANASKPRAVDRSNYLSMYFRDMAELEVLRPQEEFVAAKEIEALEVMLWERVLSYPSAIVAVTSVIEQVATNAVAETKALRRAAVAAKGKAGLDKLVKTAQKLAPQLRELDADRIFLEAVLAELYSVERGDPRAVSRSAIRTSTKAYGEYMRLVHAADRAAADARNDFVKANLRLVVSIARRFNHGRMALADLIQEGNLGLIKAVERYDYRKGFRFSTYASWWIRHAISRALADKGREVRLPVHMIDAQHKLTKARRQLTASLGREPSTAELATATEMPADKVERMRSYLLDQSVSLDKPVNDADGRVLGEVLPDPAYDDDAVTEGLEVEALSAEVRSILGTLKPIEADILRRRFGLDDDNELTLKQIGEKYSLSRERIRQLQEQALDKMRRALQRKEMF